MGSWPGPYSGSGTSSIATARSPCSRPRTKVDVILPKQRPAARVDDIHLVAVYQLVEAGGVATEAGLSAALDAKPA
jgi:hypothetical protein